MTGQAVDDVEGLAGEVFCRSKATKSCQRQRRLITVSLCHDDKRELVVAWRNLRAEISIICAL